MEIDLYCITICHEFVPGAVLSPTHGQIVPNRSSYNLFKYFDALGQSTDAALSEYSMLDNRTIRSVN